MKTKLFTLLFAVAASVGTIYASDTQVDGIWYDFKSSTKTATVTYRGSYSEDYSNEYSGSIVIPASVTYNNVTYSVTSIGTRAFYDCTGLASVIIPNSVTSIASIAFHGCTGLTSVTIGNSVTSIGMFAFEGCTGLTSVHISDIAAWCAISFGGSNANPLYYAHNLYLNEKLVTDLVIPNSVTSIGSSAFANCSGLTSVTIGNSVTNIGSDAFSGCSGLTSVTIPNSVTSIGSQAFIGVLNIVYSGSATGAPWGAKYFNGYVDGYLVYSDNTKTTLLACSTSAQGEIVIPNSVTSIGNNAFYSCRSLTSVIIPNSVTSIGTEAFHYCSGLTSVTIPNSVTSIGDWAFRECTSLPVIDNLRYADTYLIRVVDENQPTYTIKKGTRWIGSGAFANCKSLTSVTIPNSVSSIGIRAFNGCSNLNVAYIGNSVISIEEEAFFNCNQLFKIIMLPNSVPSGINSAFETLAGRITYVGNTNYQSGYDVLGAQRVYSNLNSYFTVDGVVYALVNPSQRTCDIIDCDYSGATTEFTIGNTVVYRNISLTIDSINFNAFRNNQKMTKLFVDGNHAIPSYMAYNCTSLDTLVITSSVGNIGNLAFGSCSQNTNAYYTINNSGNIGNSAFYNCGRLNRLMVGDSVKDIGSYAFQNCYGLEEVTIQNNGNIGTQAFAGSSTQNPATYTISNVGSIDESAFANCTSMTNLTIDTCVTTIGNTAFQNCYGLEEVIIKNKGNIGTQAFTGSSTQNPATYLVLSVGQIGESAFANCTSMTNLTIDTCVTTIGQYAFQNCYGLEEVTIQNNGNIGTQAFAGSSTQNPATYTISNVGSIGESAFANCTSMTNLTIDTCVTTIGNTAFQNCYGLEEVTIQNNGNIGAQAFKGSSTQNPATYIISNIGSIGTSAFANCTSIKSLSIDTCVTSINQSAFQNCYGITHADIRNNGSIGNYSFQNCYGLEDVTILNKGDIGTQAFAGSSTQNPATYTISNVGSIGESAFANCTSMTNLTIDTCVTTIGNTAFQNCYGLEDVTIQNKGNIGTQTFAGSSTQNPASYTISNVGAIGESAFANCSKLQKARLGNQIPSINQSAFSGCVLLDSITMPNTISSWGASAFYNCAKLAYAKLSNQLTSIDQSTFAGCSTLPELFIPKSVSTIGNSAFKGCSALSIVSFEDSSAPLSLGTNASNQGLFYDCHLDSLYIGRELNYPKTASNGYSPFYRNSSLRSIVISDFPTKVETNEFYGCTKLYSVYIGNGVQSIGDYAFSGCSSIDYFSFGNQVQTIGAEAFSDCVAMTRLYSYCQVPPTCGASALADIDKWNCTLYIPKNTINDYAAANQWMDFFFIEENEEGGEGIQYTISVDFDATKGTVTGAGVYNIGTEVILVATPAEGCTFVAWEDGSTNPERHIYAYKSETYTATFSAPNYELYNGNDIAVTGESVLNNIEIDRVSYPNAIAYSYSTTTDINLPDNICGQNIEGDWYADSIALIDAQPFYAPYDVEAKQLSYARTFENDQWQALYVPFDMQYSDFSSQARIAYVNNVHQYDDDDNGVIDRTVIEFISVVNDDIKANWPYIVKPNTAGEMTFNVANTTLHATEENDVECQSAFTRFNIIGTYQNTPIINKYIVHNSEFELCESLQTVSPFRIYLVVTNKYPTSPQPAPMRITFMIDGREEPAPTGVEVLFENDSTGETYDVLGRPVSHPSHGIFIRNGEKILVK